MPSQDQYHNPVSQEQNYAERLRQMQQKSSMAQKAKQAQELVQKVQKIKKIVTYIRWVVYIITILFGNPVAWVIWAAIFIIFFAYGIIGK